MTLFQDKKRKDNLERVRSRLENALLTFFHTIGPGTEFRASDLVEAMKFCSIACAPDSPGRIMRLLKRDGEIDYKVVSRKDSLYKLLAVH